MEISRKCCRLCLTETEFNVSLFGAYSRKNNMIDKILVCLKIIIEEKDTLNTICYKCANNVEKYYDFIVYVKKSQTKLDENEEFGARKRFFDEPPTNHVKRQVTSYVREQVYDADYTFSFLEVPNEEKKETNASSPFFSYFSPANVMFKSKEPTWKTPRPLREERKSEKREETYKNPRKSRHNSRDFFESQSQDADEGEQKSLDWKLTPDDDIIKRVRAKCFGLSDF